MRALITLFGAAVAACVAGCPALMSDDFTVRPVDGGLTQRDATTDSAASETGGGTGGEGGPDATIADGGADGEPSTDGADGAQPLPRSCLDIHNAGVTVDGMYVIDVDGPGPTPAFSVYCNRMTTVEPLEYLELPANLEAGVPGANVSGYAGGGPGCPSPPVTLVFFKVRLNVQTLQIDPTDRTFAYFEEDAGSLAANPSFEYGAAGSCLYEGDMSGRGNVDLTGTPFRMTMNTVFVPAGFQPAGTSMFSVDRKRVDLTGGGYSGWCEIPADAGGIGLEFAP